MVNVCRICSGLVEQNHSLLWCCVAGESTEDILELADKRPPLDPEDLRTCLHFIILLANETGQPFVEKPAQDDKLGGEKESDSIGDQDEVGRLKVQVHRHIHTGASSNGSPIRKGVRHATSVPMRAII